MDELDIPLDSYPQWQIWEWAEAGWAQKRDDDEREAG